METRGKKREREEEHKQRERTTNATGIVNDMMVGKVMGDTNKESLIGEIAQPNADLVDNNQELVDKLTHVPSKPNSVSSSSSLNTTPTRDSKGTSSTTHMSREHRPPGSETVLRIMKNRLLRHLNRSEMDDRTIQRELENFIEKIADNLISDTHTVQTVSNQDIQKFLYEHLSVNVNRGDIRPCVTMKIGDMQQMKDVWGRQVTEYAKGMGDQGSEKAKCYLCGMNIVPFGSCPEMEHKYPATTGYSRLHHYRLLQVYKGGQDGDYTKSMYTLWKEFVNIYDQNELIKLYKLINHNEEYNVQSVDNAYRTIFNSFWRTTRYHIDRDPISAPAHVTDGDKAETDNEINQHMYNFLYYFIKSWLMEFAYSHHICNQAKSDIGIWQNDQDMNKFIDHATNKAKPKNTAGNVKAGTESTQMQGRLNAALNRRKDRTKNMFEDLNTTAHNYKTNYAHVSRVIVSQGEDAKRVTEAMVMLKALYYVTNSASDTTEGPPAKAEDPNIKITKKKAIQESYEELLEKEREILEMENNEKRGAAIHIFRVKADRIRVIFENARNEYKDKYNEDPIDACMSECRGSDGENPTEKIPATPPKKPRSGTGGTRRRRPRSKRRRVSKKKKTRKRKARKTVHKRRSK